MALGVLVSTIDELVVRLNNLRLLASLEISLNEGHYRHETNKGTINMSKKSKIKFRSK